VHEDVSFTLNVNEPIDPIRKVLRLANAHRAHGSGAFAVRARVDQEAVEAARMVPFGEIGHAGASVVLAMHDHDGREGAAESAPPVTVGQYSPARVSPSKERIRALWRADTGPARHRSFAACMGFMTTGSRVCAAIAFAPSVLPRAFSRKASFPRTRVERNRTAPAAREKSPHPPMAILR
jgi:hypothetical protein